MAKVIFHDIRNCSYTLKEFPHSESKVFPLREVPIMKRETFEDNHCLIQLSLFDVRYFFSVLATPLVPLGFIISRDKAHIIDATNIY